MIVGIVWPTPGPGGQLDPGFLQKLARTRATHLRVDLDYRNPDVDRIVEDARTAGFEVLPILALDYDHVELGPYLDFCQRIVETHGFPAVEILNEPFTMHGMSDKVYGQIANAAGRRLKGMTRVVLAGDFIQFDRKGPKFKDKFRFSKANLDLALYDAVAIHPYRNPGRPKVTKFRTRREEYETWAREGGGKPLIVTEVGWDLRNGVDEQKQADYLMEELILNARLGIEATYIYAHISDDTGFGVFRDNQEPRPAAYRIAQFQAAGQFADGEGDVTGVSELPNAWPDEGAQPSEG